MSDIKIGRPKKNEKYKIEQEEVFKKLMNVLGITDTNRYFYLYDIDNDKKKEAEIMELWGDVKKYFSVRQYGVFINPAMKRGYSSLIRSVLKETKTMYNSGTTSIDRKGKKMVTTYYLI